MDRHTHRNRPTDRSIERHTVTRIFKDCLSPSFPASPAYSIAHGWPGGKDKTVGPGPAAYKPDSRYNQHGKAGGPYAFATWKPKDPLERRGPGPTDYDTIKRVCVNSEAIGPLIQRGPGPTDYDTIKRVCVSC